MTDAEQIAELKEYIKQLESWKYEGDRIFNGRGFSLMFLLGGWWADRPWRTTKNLNLGDKQ